MIPAGAERDLARHQAEVAARERWLASAEARQQRQNSRLAHTDLGAAEARELLLRKFAPTLEAIAPEPVADPERIERFIDDRTAVVGPADGEAADPGDTQIVTSTLPLRAPANGLGGPKEPVELELEREGGEFETANAIVELSIPERLDEPVELDVAGGIAIRPKGAREQAKAMRISDTQVMYPNALGEGSDTDLVVSVLPLGGDLLTQIRSERSPERFAYELDLAPGRSLVQTPGGSIEIRGPAGPEAVISAPLAVDAQGSPVEATLSKVGEDEIAIDIPHRGLEVARPILLDPVIQTFNFPQGSPTTGWGGAGQSPYWWSTTCNSSNWTCDGAGLYVFAPTNNYPAGRYGRWYWRVPGYPTTTTYVESANFQYVNYRSYNAVVGHPTMLLGILGSGDYVGYKHWYPTTNGGTYLYGWNHHVTSSHPGSAPPTTGKEVHFQLINYNSMNLTVSPPKKRNIYLKQAAFYLTDPEAPTLDPVPPAQIPTGWITGGGLTASASAHDPGLGVRKLTLQAPGQPDQIWRGDMSGDGSDCTGLHADRCKANLTNSFTYSADAMPQGVSTVTLRAEDAVGGAGHTANPRTWQVKVDRTPPQLALSGQFVEAVAEDEALGMPTYKLKVDATDGDVGNPRSGVKRVEIRLDDPESEPVHSVSQSCPEGSCPMTVNWTLEPLGLSPGPHKLIVTAIDQLDHPRTRTEEFELLPATGILDEYVMQYVPLVEEPEPTGEADGYVGPELAVNVATGNLVFRTRDAEAEGLNVDLELERFYNSQLPEGESSEWGNGWTLAQTPTIAPEDGASPAEAELTGPSGYLAEGVELPTEPEGESFDPDLQATITAQAEGGYELAFEDTDDVLVFGEDGRVEERRSYNDAAVEYGYEDGMLTDLATDDPQAEEQLSAELEHVDGLVSELAGDEVGEHSYQHDQEGNLTSHLSPEGETTYDYDEDGRLTGIELPDGTTASIVYDTHGRVTSIGVTSGGATKTTTFAYEDDPRRTTVTEPGGLITTYQVAASGWVFRSTSGFEAPEFDDLAGSLWVNRGELLEHGAHSLIVEASSSSPMGSIQILKDGHEQLDEVSCEGGCPSLSHQWETSTGAQAAGTLDLEVLATDANGRMASERFQLIVPVEEAEAEEDPSSPSFSDAQSFRNEYALPADSTTVNDTLSDPTLAPSVDRWGVPLRPNEEAELRYREGYAAQAATAIPQWAAQHAPSSYAGYYVDHAQGGKIIVGFTANQSALVADLKQTGGLAAADRVESFPSQPTYTLAYLRQLRNNIAADARTVAPLPGLVNSVSIDLDGNRVSVGAVDVQSVMSTLSNRYPQGGFEVVSGSPVVPRAGFSRRNRVGAVQAGDDLGGCTANFGAWDRVGTRRNKAVFAHFILTAGHCFHRMEKIYQGGSPWEVHVLGRVRRYAWDHEPDPTDAEAIRASKEKIPRKIHISRHAQWRIKGATGVYSGQTVCHSGISTPFHCGPIENTEPENTVNDRGHWTGWLVRAEIRGALGDSGAPIWERDSGRAVGIHSHGCTGCPDTLIAPIWPIGPAVGARVALGEIGIATAP